MHAGQTCGEAIGFVQAIVISFESLNNPNESQLVDITQLNFRLGFKAVWPLIRFSRVFGGCLKLASDITIKDDGVCQTWHILNDWDCIRHHYALPSPVIILLDGQLGTTHQCENIACRAEYPQILF